MYLCGSNNEGGTIRKVRNKKNPSVKRMDPNLYIITVCNPINHPKS